MITRTFNKSSTTNIFIVVAYLTLVFFTTCYNIWFLGLKEVLLACVSFIIILVSVFLHQFIVSKNNLTERNNYALLMFVLLLAIFPKVLQHFEILLANLLLLYALRRLISLRNNNDTKMKLFDASFCTAMATLFFFWSILFFIVIGIALLFYVIGITKNWLIPLFGVISVFVLLICYNIIFHDVYFSASNLDPAISFNYTIYNTKASILKLTIFLSSALWIMVYFFQITFEKNKTSKPSFVLVLCYYIIALFIALLSPIKDGIEFIFLFVPFSIVMTNYLQVIPERWLKEFFLSLFILTPFIALLLQ